MATPRIIFVHGMGEKPEPEAERLRMWEPLARSLWTPIPLDAFSVAYWADLRLPSSAPPTRTPPPIVRSLPVRQRADVGWALGGLRPYLTRPELLALNVAERARRVGQALSQRFFSSRAGKAVTGAFRPLLRDLEHYMDGGTRAPIVRRVVQHLEEERGQPICVISHSMGTVVALEAILQWDGDVDTLVTLGSPLGWEYLRGWLGVPAYPANLRHWFNLYDRLDTASFYDRRIADDYLTADGTRLIIDRRVRDNYAPNGDRDPHHWYGFLSSPELVDIVCHFWLGAGGFSRAVDATMRPR